MQTTEKRVVIVVLSTAFVLGSITLYYFVVRNRAEFFAMMWVDFSWYAVTWLSMGVRLLFKGPYRKPAKAKPSEVSCLDEYVL
jgi:hypothetical protein